MSMAQTKSANLSIGASILFVTLLSQQFLSQQILSQQILSQPTQSRQIGADGIAIGASEATAAAELKPWRGVSSRQRTGP